LGLGLLGLDPERLYDLTFREFGNAVRGRYEFQEHCERGAWERVRWQTALLLNVHTKKGSKLTTHDLAVFPWEENTQTQKPKGNGLAILRALANGKTR